MGNITGKLITLFERKIELLLERNEGYARFKGLNLRKAIKKMLSNEPSRVDIMDLGFLLHLYALQLRLTMYKSLSPFSLLNFKKDLQEIINALHAYKKHKTLPFITLAESQGIQKLIPPLLELSNQERFSQNNNEFYNVILDMLEEDIEEVDVEIPEDIIRQMQYIDLKIIYEELPKVIEKKTCYTVRQLACDFPVFDNDRLSLVSVFNEVLFLANEGKVFLKQMEDDVWINML